jgi:DNA polymerase
MPRPTLKPEFIEGEIIPAILKGDVSKVHKNVNEACANMLRSVIVAKPGSELVVSDWANIEGRVLAWLAGEQWKLEGYKLYDKGEGPDSYVALYARSFGISVDEVTGEQRQMGKGMDLSMGFGGGVGAFRNVAATYGLDLDDLGRTVPDLVHADILKKADARWAHEYIRGEDLGLEPDVFIACDALKQVWRKAHPAITELWWTLERGIKSVIRNRGTVWTAARCKIWYTGQWLIIELPSGRRLLYANPQVKIIYEHDEETDEPVARDSISYMNANIKQWRRERSYGGKFAENITQAVANDVLRAALVTCKREGWSTVLHVHDEIINEEPYGTRSLESLNELMTRELPWSKGLPLAAAGYVSDRYKKD